MSHDRQSPELPRNDSVSVASGAHALRKDITALKVEILSYLEVALVRYPRSPGETLRDWFDRIIPRHVATGEYPLILALGIAEGASIDVLTDEFERALQSESGVMTPCAPGRNTPSTRETSATCSEDSESSPLQFERREASPWKRKPLGDFSVDSNSWVTIRVRFNRDHYMSSSCYGVAGSSRVGNEVEAALASGHTYDSIFQEGLTKISHLDGNYVMVPIGDLIVWSEGDPDFWGVFRALEKEGRTRSEIFKAGLVAIHGPVAPHQELFEIDASNLEEERPGVWTGILGDAPPVKPR